MRLESKEKTFALGIAFALFLIISYFENRLFLENVRGFFVSPAFTVVMFFIHNAIAVSLIIIGMSFYVKVVKNFLPKRRIEYIVLNHPHIFALVFTAIILISSVFRVSVIMGGKAIDMISTAMTIFLPHGVLEALGIYVAVHRTLTERLKAKTLAGIYFLFFLAAFLEVGFIIALITFAI